MNPSPQEIAKHLEEAELIVRKQAIHGSLTQKILDGWFGEADRKYLFFRKARELAKRGLTEI